MNTDIILSCEKQQVNCEMEENTSRRTLKIKNSGISSTVQVQKQYISTLNEVTRNQNTSHAVAILMVLRPNYRYLLPTRVPGKVTALKYHAWPTSTVWLKANT